MAHGQRTEVISLAAFSDGFEPSSHAIHLTAASATTTAATSVRLR